MMKRYRFRFKKYLRGKKQTELLAMGMKERRRPRMTSWLTGEQ